jgi:hypothetical protein
MNSPSPFPGMRRIGTHSYGSGIWAYPSERGGIPSAPSEPLPPQRPRWAYMGPHMITMWDGELRRRREEFFSDSWPTSDLSAVNDAAKTVLAYWLERRREKLPAMAWNAETGTLNRIPEPAQPDIKPSLRTRTDKGGKKRGMPGFERVPQA